MKTGKKKALLIFLGSSVVLAILAVVGIIIYLNIYYKDKWYKNTMINQVDVSGQTLEESKKSILNKMGNYSLTIKGRDGGKLVIDGDDIDYKLTINNKFDKTFKKEHKNSPVFPKKTTFSITYNVSYNKKRLKKILRDSEIVKGSDDYKITSPASAKVVFSDDKKIFECVDEVYGNKIVVNNLTEAIENSLEKAEHTLNINDKSKKAKNVVEGIYKEPKILGSSDVIKDRLSMLNKAALRFIEWNMGKGVTESITPDLISEWITFKNNKVIYNWDKVSKWAEAFCLKYKTVDKERNVKMHNGKIVTVKAGDYGWQIDYDRTYLQIKKALKEKIDDELIDAYIKDPSDENRTKLTSKRKVQYSTVAFQKDFVNFNEDWDPNNFIEVSLSEQKVYVIRDGKVKFSCKTISGRPTPERATKKGAYFIKEHNSERILVGDTYKTPVKNWVRITWSGTGFHSATWQRWSRWTKDYYKTKGSHGCLNLSLEDSKKIYDLTKYREAVFIY